MPILVNHRSKFAKIHKIRKIHKISKIGKIGKIGGKMRNFGIFLKSRKFTFKYIFSHNFIKIYAFLAFLQHLHNFYDFIKEIPEIGKNRTTYPRDMSDK